MATKIDCINPMAQFGAVSHNNLSDFVLTQQIKQNGVVVNVDDFDWEIDYFTTPLGTHYIASNVGGVLTNCRKLDDHTVLVLFLEPGFLPGKLQFEARLQLPNKAFESGIERVVVPGDTGILIVEGKGDAPIKINTDTLEKWLTDTGG